MANGKTTKTERVMGVISSGGAAGGTVGGAARVPEHSPDGPFDLERTTSEIIALKAEAGRSIIGIGVRLIEAKAALPHGQWLLWLERVDIGEVTAQRFMRLAREWTNPSTLTDLGASKALKLLALPEAEREEFIAAPHVVDGEEKTVREMSVRELDRAIKERDAAKEEAEQAKWNAAEAEADREQAEEKLAKVREESAVLERDNAELRQRVRELEARPTDVTVQTVPDGEAVRRAVEQAKAEAGAELEKVRAASAAELEKLRREKETAEERYRKADRDKTKARANLDRVGAELSAYKLAEQMREDREKAGENKVTTEDRALANLIAIQMGDNLNRIAGILKKSRTSGDAELEAMLRQNLERWKTGMEALLA